MKKWIMASMVLFWLGCGSPTDEQPPVEVIGPDSVTCEGPKCDGLADTFRDAYDDMRNLSLDDLTVLSAGLATDGLNDALSNVPYATISISPTALYGAHQETLGQTVVHDMAQLRSGLSDRFGERAFATRVIELRQQHAASTGSIWGESHFAIGPNLGHNWNFNAGEEVVGNVGFTASAQIETVVIAPYADKRESIVDAPLAAVRETRGWIVPRDLSDVQTMAPGESLAMRGQGALGFNLGVGIPYLIGTVGSTVSLNARLNLGARVALNGKLDVQLIRGAGNDAWVDVGIDEQTVRAFRVAVTSGFGVSGLPSVDLNLGVGNFDVTRLAERALEKQLNKSLNAELAATTNKETTRMTVARFRFDLSRVGADDFNGALEQAMRGDLRLAQALANRGDAGVAQELDLTKDARSESNYVGFRFLGMEFYRANSFDTGTISIESDGTNQTLLFSELERKSGLFFTDRQYEWRKVVSVKTQDGRLVTADNNARMTIREGDKFLGRDQMLDHVDPLIAYLVGFVPLWSDVNVLADALAETIDKSCVGPTAGSSSAERRAYDECIAALPSSPDVVAQRNAVEAAVNVALGEVWQGFDARFASSNDIARRAMDFKLALINRVDRTDVQFFGPEGRMLTQIRFSDDALETMMVPGRHEQFRQVVEDVLRLMASRRGSDVERKQKDVDAYIERRVERLDDIAQLYALATVDWADLEDISQVTLQGMRIGDYGHMVLVPEDAPNDVDLGSIAEHKGRIIESLIPEMVDLAKRGIFRDLGEPEEFVIAYALLWMADPSSVELLVNYVFDDDDPLAFDDLDLYGRGTSELIDAGKFDLDQLLGKQ